MIINDLYNNKKQGVAEASLGDYRKKAMMSKAMAQTDRFFGRDDAAKVAAADQTIAKRQRGLARADARIKPYTPPPHDAEKHQRDLTAKYPNIDELVASAELNRDPDYEYAEGPAYYRGREAEQHYQRLRQIQRVIQGLNEHKERSKTMRLKEITESQLDEISLDQIGRGVGGVLGGIGKTVGAVAGVPQGIGRAVKKGYRGAVKGIGGAADDGSDPRSDVPGAAYGDTSNQQQYRQVPSGSGRINPDTGRGYTPDELRARSAPQSTPDTTSSLASGGSGPAADIQTQIADLDRNYKTQRAALMAKLNAPDASGPPLTPQQRDYISAIGTDEPGTSATATTPAVSAAPDRSYEVNPVAVSAARDPKVLGTLQALDAKQLQMIKKILQAKARATAESDLNEVAFGDVWRGTGDKLKNATSGITDFAKSAYKTAKPLVKKAGKIAAAVPGAVAKGAGAVAGGVAGMKTAARKGYAAGQKHVGGGELTMDELQQAISGMTADDAKQLLMFVKQLEIQNAPPKKKSKAAGQSSTRRSTPTSTTIPTPVPGSITPTATVMPQAMAPVAESLIWSPTFNPGRSLYLKMKQNS